MNQYAPGRFEIPPTIVKNLLIINGIMFLATLLFKQQEVSLIDMFGLHSIGSEGFRPYQLITHMFMHLSLIHI